MSLSAGTKLGPYEIGAPLGAGGMGEVYRATDKRLDRVVAIKILPASIAAAIESGKSEIYVTSFPEARGKWQVSNAEVPNPPGGVTPRNYSIWLPTEK